MGRQCGSGESIKEHDVVTLWGPAEVLQRQPAELLRIQRGRDFIVGKQDVLAAERQAMFEPGKIENCLGAILTDAASDNPPAC